MKTIKFLLAILFSMAVAACGGGGSSSSTPASNTISGIAAKGPIGGAEVLVFKAGDYSSSTDDAKALNAATPAPTDATGHYSVTVNYSGPVIVVVRPKAGATICNELTGLCTAAFNFRMRAALASVAANTTAHITPFTEMAAKAVGTSNSAAAIDIANWAVRMKVLAGLDPLTTSPVVDSRVDPTVQVAQKQMVVALAAVAQASGGMIGTTDCSTDTDPIACAVNALGDTVSNIVTSTTTADISGSNVAVLSTAMSALTTIHVPTLDANGNLSTTTTLDTTTDTDATAVETLVATNSAALGNGVVTTTSPSTTMLSGVDKAKAFFSDLRTNLHLFANSAQTGLLNLQGTRIQTDMTNEIAPDMTKATNRLHHLMKGADLLSNGSSVGATRTGGSFPNDFLCTLTSATTVKCLSRSGYSGAGIATNYLQVVITASGTPTPSAATATYAATAMTCTSDGTGGAAVGGSTNWPGCSNAPGSVRTDKATGAGTFSYATDTAGNLTSLTISNGASGPGTFPGSNTGVVQDSVALTGNLTGPATGSQTLNFSGSVSSYGGTGTTANPTPMVTLAIGSGSYATDQQVLHTKTPIFTCGMYGCSTSYVTCTANCTWPELSALNVILVANTPNTAFTGTLTMGGAMFDASGTQWIPTTATFIGTIADTSVSGAGEFMTGKLELADTNYASHDATQPDSAANFNMGTAKFTGTLAFPGAQPMNLVLAGSTTGFTTSTLSVNFSYGNGKSISVTSAPIDGTSNSNTVTLTNQDGLMVTLTQGQNAAVKVGSDTVATVGNNNMINYSDGYVESLN